MSKAMMVVLDPRGAVVAAFEGAEAVVFDGYQIISGSADDYAFREAEKNSGVMRLVDNKTGEIVRGEREDESI